MAAAPASRDTEPWVATEPLPPAEVGSVDELYLTGVHLAQYRHPTRSPGEYWQEALRRDPGDARTNVAVADEAYRRAEYPLAEEHVRRALERLTTRNANPRDGEASYLLGLVLARTGRDADAYDAFAKAAWDTRWAAAATLELGRLDARAGRWGAALVRADAAIAQNFGDSRARALRVTVLRVLGRQSDADAELAGWLALDPLDQVARALAGRSGSGDPRTVIDVALELAADGSAGVGLEMLSRAAAMPPGLAGDVRAMAHYHRAAILDRLGRADDAAAARAAARAASPDWCFPIGLDDHDALRAALAADPGDGRAAALLGMLLLDRGREAEALELWEAAIAGGLEDAVTYRNAAIVVFNLHGDAERALHWYGLALGLDRNARLLYERDQLLARTGAPARERLALLDQERAELLQRDDLTVEYCRLLAGAGRAVEALSIMESRRFAPWEGGEGLAVAAWEDVTLALSDGALSRGDLEAAASFARRAIDLPDSLGETRHPLTDTRELHERLAKLLLRLGRTADAESVRAAAVVNDGGPVSPTRADGGIDYFATSLPDLLLFAERELTCIGSRHSRVTAVSQPLEHTGDSARAFACHNARPLGGHMSEHTSRNKKEIAVVAVVAGLVLGGGGAAVAYWTSTGSGTGEATTGENTDFVVTSLPASGAALTPGGPGQSVTFNVENPSTGGADADRGHRGRREFGRHRMDRRARLLSSRLARVGTPVITYGVIRWRGRCGWNGDRFDGQLRFQPGRLPGRRCSALHHGRLSRRERTENGVAVSAYGTNRSGRHQLPSRSRAVRWLAGALTATLALLAPAAPALAITGTRPERAPPRRPPAYCHRRRMW